MDTIDLTVSKLFGYTKLEDDPNSKEFMIQSIKDSENIISKYYGKTPNDLIVDFLFEQTDVAKELKRIMDKYKYDTEEKNT